MTRSVMRKIARDLHRITPSYAATHRRREEALARLRNVGFCENKSRRERLVSRLLLRLEIFVDGRARGALLGGSA